MCITIQEMYKIACVLTVSIWYQTSYDKLHCISDSIFIDKLKYNTPFMPLGITKRCCILMLIEISIVLTF